MLDRLTYANVVATLALFIALGGSAYAVTQIGSNQVKNRSLKGVDLRRNTIGGTEVRESKLRRVPRAAAADRAQQADNATNAANSALAGLATNAERLGGQGAGFFEKSSRTQFTRVSGLPPNVQSEGTVLQWDALGLVVTVPTQGGCSDPDEVTLRISNTRPSGAPLLFTREVGQVLSITPGGGSTIACSGQVGHDGHWQGVAAYGNEDPTLFFDCQRLANEVRCLSTRSAP